MNTDKYNDKLTNKYINKCESISQSPKLAVVSGAFPEVMKALNECGFDVIPVYPYGNNTKNPEASHADMQVLRIDERKIVLLKGNDELNSRLTDKLKNTRYNIFYTGSGITEFVYPDCVKLNIAVVGKNAIGNFKYADSLTVDVLKNSGYNFIDVKQGYAKCSSAVVGDNAIITSDISVFKSAVKNGIDCLKISEGHIELCERYEGFIGGASFLMDRSTLAFTGDVTAHPDYMNIKSFCLNYGVRLLSLTASRLCDVGGVILFYE